MSLKDPLIREVFLDHVPSLSFPTWHMFLESPEPSHLGALYMLCPLYSALPLSSITLRRPSDGALSREIQDHFRCDNKEDGEFWMRL